jgi:hypothetical protein
MDAGGDRRPHGYELLRLSDSPVVRLNRAVAVGEADGARVGLAALADVDAGLPRHADVSAYLHEKDGDLATAARQYADAARAASNLAERDHLTRQAHHPGTAPTATSHPTVSKPMPRAESFALFDGCRLSSRRGQIADSVGPPGHATAALYRQLGTGPGRTAWRAR